MMEEEGTALVPRRQRCLLFRQFIIDMYGIDYLRSGVVLDVAGGKGDLSWTLTNADGISSVIVDPRVTDHTKIHNTAIWFWEHRGQEALMIARGPQGYLRDLALTPPFQIPRHLRIFLDESLLGALYACRSKLQADACAAQDWSEYWSQANSRAEASEPCGHHQPLNLSANICAHRIEDAGEAYKLLTTLPRLIIGFHPDQATDSCIDLALQLRIPFCVVPCCVFPNLFSHRVLSNGRKVRYYEDYLAYLREKDARIRVAHLAFGGGSSDMGAGTAAVTGDIGKTTGDMGQALPRSVVLYMLPSDFDSDTPIGSVAVTT